MRRSAVNTRWVTTTLGLLLAAAPWTAALAQSAVRGQTLFESRCVACHSLNENRVGPALRTVVGRVAGTAKNYAYSPALAAAKHRWNRDLLLAWLTDPEKVVAGQRMGYRVEASADREDLVAYLYAQDTGRGAPRGCHIDQGASHGAGFRQWVVGSFGAWHGFGPKMSAI